MYIIDKINTLTNKMTGIEDIPNKILKFQVMMLQQAITPEHELMSYDSNSKPVGPLAAGNCMPLQ